jgi:hypothetical protein
LKELLRTVIADGEFGLTLRSGEPPVVHTPTGSRRIEGTEPTADEIEAFLRQRLHSVSGLQGRIQMSQLFLPILGIHARCGIGMIARKTSR